MLENIAYFVGIFFFIMYGVMPLVIKSKMKPRAHYELTPADREVFLEASDGPFRALYDEILANGFRYAAASSYEHNKTHTRFALFVHDLKKSSILLTQIDAPNVPRLLYVEIGVLFDDLSMLDVSNSRMKGTFPKSPRKATFRFPEVTEVAQLVEISQYIQAHYLSSRIAIVFPEGDELKMLERLMNEEVDELVARGYFTKNTVGDNMRGLTFKGAYFMTWKLLWPVRQIREKRDVAFSQKILKASQA